MIVSTARMLALLTLWGAAPALAQDYLETAGKLSDVDFYRLVACRALPGEPCTEDIVRWAPDRASDLTVALRPVAAGFPAHRADTMSRALDGAIAELNASGAALHLRRTAKTDPDADIRVLLLPIGEGEPVRGSDVPDLEGEPIGAAFVYVWWNDFAEITEAAIIMAVDIPADQALPVMLEELTQSMGLLTDIRNPHYESLSVFSEDSNDVTKLGQQDRMALRRHYPPPG